MSRNLCNYMDYGGGLETIKGHTRGGTRMAIWLQAKVRERGLGLLYAGCICDAQRRCSCSMRLVELWRYISAMFLPFCFLLFAFCIDLFDSV